MTGGKVELRALSIQWLAMRATIKGLVIHGKEHAGTEPSSYRRGSAGRSAHRFLLGPQNFAGTS